MSNLKKSSKKHVPRTWLRPSVPAAARLGAMAGAALIAAAICIAYYPAFSSGFILDDDKLLTANWQIQASDGPYQFWLTTIARSHGQTALARQAGDLLNSIHAGSPDLKNAPPSSR